MKIKAAKAIGLVLLLGLGASLTWFAYTADGFIASCSAGSCQVYIANNLLKFVAPTVLLLAVAVGIKMLNSNRRRWVAAASLLVVVEAAFAYTLRSCGPAPGCDGSNPMAGACYVAQQCQYSFATWLFWLLPVFGIGFVGYSIFRARGKKK